MQAQNVKVKNFRGMPDLELNFKGSGLYIFKGGNEIGKTTFMSIFGNHMKASESSPIPTTLGKTKGSTETKYTNSNGDTATVTETFEANGKPKFKMVYNDFKDNSVTSIRDLFDFNDMSAEDFIALGNTTPGKRKQLEYVLNMLTTEEKTEFYTLKDKEEKLVESRKFINKDVKTLALQVKTNKLSEEDITILKTKKETTALYDSLVDKFNNIELDTVKKKNIEDGKESFLSNVNIASEQINGNVSDEVIEKFDSVIKLITDIYDRDIKAIELPKTEELQQRIKAGKSRMDTISDLDIKDTIYDTHVKNLKSKEEEQVKANKDIDDLRNTIEHFFEDKNLPIKELIVGTLDEGLYVKTELGVLPFNSDQLSTSQVMFITLKIMYFVNKNVNMIFLGRIESFDELKLKALTEFAKEYNVQIIADEVVRNSDNFVVELLWDVDNSEELLSIPVIRKEIKNIPNKIEKRKEEGRVSDDKKMVDLPIKKKEEPNDDIKNQKSLF